MMAMPTSPTKSGFSFVKQHRNVSGGSDATFPRRADAYVATDLMTRASEDGHIYTPPPPPAVPYPSLLQILEDNLDTIASASNVIQAPRETR